MTESEVKARAFAMPLTSPAFPPGPYRFVNREFFIITYRTDPDALRAVIPAPLEMAEPIVRYEFIKMPDSTGFGDYTESGQVIPVTFEGKAGSYVHAMYLDDEAPIAGGRELWGFPKKLASPSFKVEKAGPEGLKVKQKVEAAQLVQADALTQGLLAPAILKLPGTTFTIGLSKSTTSS